MRAVKEKANAKINLYLDVISKRADGFHGIKTVMHSLSLFDELTVIYTPSAVTCVKAVIDGCRYLPTDDKNLAVKAALLYLERAHKTANVEIRLKKQIPIAAGLAGGASDAAAVLRAMNRIFGKYFAESVLYELAADIGSDVPYCLYGKTALCEGRGELMTKLPDTLKLNAVIAVANERVSTPTAYGALDLRYSNFDGTVETGGECRYNVLMNGIKSGKINPDGVFNVFENTVLNNCRGAVYIKDRLSELGAYCAMMSGSGPSVFGLFEEASAAKAACAALRKEGINAHFARSV